MAYFRLRPRAAADEGFYGLGEYYDDVNHRGKVRSMQLEIDPSIESGYNEARCSGYGKHRGRRYHRFSCVGYHWDESTHRCEGTRDHGRLTVRNSYFDNFDITRWMT